MDVSESGITTAKIADKHVRLSNMDVSELFKGVAVVIDDEVNDVNSNIKNILSQIERENIPYLTYDVIPDDKTISHFQELSFVFLDWRLIKKDIDNEDLESGISVPSTLEEHKIEENIEFIKRLNKVCFCPIFIFTNENKDSVINALEAAKIYDQSRPNHIFIKSKIDVRGRTKMFSEVKKWLENNPSAYVLKEWEKKYRISKNKLFSEFEKISSMWPKIMWKNYKDDGGNKSQELGELISNNLHTRMAPFKFLDYILDKRGKKIEKHEIKHVIEGAMFLKHNTLHDDDSNDNITTGDIFKIKEKYYINIRPTCDCIPDRSRNDSTFDNVKLYLLKGCMLSETQSKKMFKKKYGHFSEIDSQSIFFSLHEGKTIDFRFKNLEIRTWEEIKNQRIGHILPPYINRIQQRYALYLQRQGLPRIPKSALYEG